MYAYHFVCIADPFPSHQTDTSINCASVKSDKNAFTAVSKSVCVDASNVLMRTATQPHGRNYQRLPYP